MFGQLNLGQRPGGSSVPRKVDTIGLGIMVGDGSAKREKRGVCVREREREKERERARTSSSIECKISDFYLLSWS